MKSNLPPSILTPKKMIVALGETVYSTLPTRLLTRMGWEITSAKSGPETRRLLKHSSVTFVCLDTELVDESGWLTCAKLTMQYPDLPVVLLAPSVKTYEEHFAIIVGATMILPYSTDFLDLTYCLAARKRIPGISWN